MNQRMIIYVKKRDAVGSVTYYFVKCLLMSAISAVAFWHGHVNKVKITDAAMQRGGCYLNLLTYNSNGKSYCLHCGTIDTNRVGHVICSCS